MKYRIYLKSTLAKVRGEVVRLFKAVVEERGEDWEPWEPCDESLLFDSHMDCQREAMELQELYQSSLMVNPQTLSIIVSR
jgi:hypothetical protein